MLSTDVPKSEFRCYFNRRAENGKIRSVQDPNFKTIEACKAAGGIGQMFYTPEESALFQKLFVAEEAVRQAKEKEKQKRTTIILLSVLGGVVLLVGVGFTVAYIVKRRRLNR